jgi:Spy/CpxP family protein refolding chaperone
MGPGTMYGYGPGPGMRYGYGAGALDTLNLTDEQRAKIAKIDEALATKRWELMGKMQDQRFRLRDLLASGNADDAAIGKAYRSIDTLRQQMWTAASDAQKQVDGVLTPAQREQLQRGWGRDAR